MMQVIINYMLTLDNDTRFRVSWDCDSGVNSRLNRIMTQELRWNGPRSQFPQPAGWGYFSAMAELLSAGFPRPSKHDPR
jgi:hypothetical protein